MKRFIWIMKFKQVIIKLLIRSQIRVAATKARVQHAPLPSGKNCFFFWGKGGWGRLIIGYCNHNRRQNWWYIVLEWTSFGEQNNPHPSPLPSIQSWGVCCFLQIARTAAQHCMKEMGERNLYFPFFKLAKRQKGSWGRSVSTNFVADCT